MIAFLSSPRVDRPVTVASPPGNRSARQGWVESTIDEGELFLESDGKPFRLTWKSGQKDRRRALPDGDYKIKGYRIRKTDDQGTDWHISIASPGFRKVTVRSEQGVKVDIEPTISIKLRVIRKRDELTVVARVLGEGNSGLSIYRRGKRIPLRYRVTSADGKPITTGPMRYG